MTVTIPSFSATKTWDNGGGDNLWSTATNWNPDGVPGAADDVVLNGTNSATCYYDKTSTTITSINMTGFTGRFEWGYAGYGGKGVRAQYFGDKDGYNNSTFSRLETTVNCGDNCTTTPSGIPADDYRIVYTYHVLPPFTGTYTFYEASDDGGRLWVNGNLIIDQWVDGGIGTENTATVSLTAGVITEIRYETFENVGGAGRILSWSHASLPKEVIPQSRSYPDRNGLAVTWYDNNDFTGTSGTNVAPFIDYNWFSNGPDDFWTGDDDWSGVFQGYVEPLYNETYTFYANRDDNVWVWVNDVPIIAAANCCGEVASATIDLVAGVKYKIRVEYKEFAVSANLNLSWSSASQAKEIIPTARLYVPYLMNVTGNANFNSSGTINFNAGELVFTGTGAQAFTPKSGSTFGRVIKNGTGTTTVTSNAFDVGFLEIAAGTLNLGAGLTITPDYLKISGGTINFGTSNLYLSQPTIDFSSLGTATSGANGSQIILNGTAAQTLSGTITGADVDLTFASSATTTVTGILATGTGIVTKSGTGNLNLNGANTFSGGFTQANSGTTTVGHNTGLGSGMATLGSAGKIVVASGITVANGLTIATCDPGAGRGCLEGPASGTGTWSGTITINNSAVTGGHLMGGGGRLTITGAINSGTYTVEIRDMAVTLSGGGSYARLATGSADIKVGATNGISTTAVVDLGITGATSTLDLSGFSQTIAGLTQTNAATAGTLTSSSGTPTLTINNGSAYTYPDVISGSLTLAKSGSGVQTLSGTNTYTGGTNIAAGELSVGAAANLGSPSGTYVVVYTGSGTLDVTNDITLSKDIWVNDNMTATVDVASAKTLTCNAPWHAVNAAPVHKTGAGTLVLDADNVQLDNDVFLDAGILIGKQNNALGNSGAFDWVYAAAGTTFRISADTAVTLAANVEFDGTGANFVTTRHTSGAGLTHSVNNMAVNGAFTVNVSAGTNVASGAPGLTVRGTTTLAGNTVFDVANPVSGTTLFTQTGNVSGATYTLTYQGAGNTTVAGVLGTTTGTLTKAGTGTLMLSGNNTYTGSNTLSAGTLTITTTTGLGSGNITLNSATLQVLVDGAGSNGTIALGNNLTTNSGNTPAIYVANNGSNTGNTVAFGTYNMGNSTLSVTGANGYKVSTGAMTLNGGSVGTVTFNPTTAEITIPSITGNNNTHTLTLDGTSTGSSVTGAIVDGTAAISLAKTNTSTWTLAGTSTYAGTTTVSAGTLKVTGALASATATTVASGANLTGTGSVPGTVTLSNGGIVTPGGSTGGTLSTGAQVMNATSIMNITLSPQGSSANKLAVTGNFTLDGTLNVTAGAGFTFGSYTLATYSGTLTNNTLNVGTLPSGYYGTITAGSGLVTLSLLDYSGWNYVSTIQFNTTSTGAAVSNDVTDFPMLVRLDSNNFLFNQAMPDGRDIRFADPDGTPLAYEIERWDATSRRAEIWVKVPTVNGNSDRDFINFYWGNAAATSQSSASAVFSAYKSVLHLQQSPGAGAGGFIDASGNADHGTAQGPGVAGDSSTSNIGLGYKLNGSSKYLTTATSFSPVNTYTAGIWFKTSTATGGKILSWSTAASGGAGQFDRQIWMDNAGKLYYSVYNGAQRVLNTTAAYNDGLWHLAVERLGPSGLALYVDGAQIAVNASVTTAEATTGYWRAGYDNMTGWSPSPTSNWFNGTIDEFRVAHSELSDDWIKLSYATQKQNPTAVVYSNTALSTWSYSNKVYVNTSSTGANITTDVADFPLLVRLNAGNFNWSQARTDGADLRFADSTGMLLPYEVVRYDAVAKAGEVWVLLPTIKGNNNSQWFRMYWGKPAATSLSSANAVFQPSDGVAGEYHLNETSGTAADASGYGNHGTFNGNVPNVQTGVVGKAHLFDGNGDYISAASNGTMDFSANDRFTVSAWVNRSGANVGSAYEGLVTKFGFAAGDYRSFALSHNSATGFRLHVSSDGAAGTEIALSSGLVATNGTWYHVAGVADGSKIRVYVNGIEQANTAFVGNIYYSALAPLRIGWVDNSQYFNGLIDEASISSEARSADWIKLQYESQKAASTMVNIGSRPADFAKSTRFNFNTTATGANITGSDVTNIPILVRLTSANFDFSRTTAAGTDIQFIDKDGSYLYHEVVEWDKGNSVGKVWVKVPQVDRNSTTDFITLYYGCAACTASPYAMDDSVWSGYKAMYHLNGGDESRALDVSPYANNLTYNNATASNAGLTAHETPYFEGTAASYASVTDPAGGEQDMGTGDFTAGCWIRTSQTATSGIWPTPLGKLNQAGTYAGWALELEQAGASAGKIRFDVRSTSSNYSPFSSAALNDGNWHFVVGKKTSTINELFVDGVSQGTTALSLGSISNSVDFTVAGTPSGNSNRYQGNVGEASLAATAFTADYIKLQYENQKAASTLFSATTLTTASFQKSKVFALNTTASGANVAGDVYNFPLLLRIAGNATGTATPITDLTQTAGQDIRFLDGDGVTWLDYQIERWSPTLDSAEVWVKVPKVRGNSNSDRITMYYQQASGVTVPDGQCATCVFGTDNGHAAAWHLNASLTDATVNANNGTDNGTTDGEGVVANGRGFNGSSQNARFGNGNSLKTITDGETVEAWVKTTQSGVTASVIRHDGHFTPLQINGGTLARVSAWNSSLTPYTFTWSPNFNTGTWQHFAVNYSRTAGLRVYRNGALLITTAATTPLTSGGSVEFYMGSSESGTEWYNGRLDEVRVSNVVRSDDWIKLSYQNQRRDAAPLFNPSPADFVSSRKYPFNTTRTGANVMDSVTNFPLLVRIAGSAIVDAVQNNAPDIRFLDGDGKTWLNYQVERWDKTLDSAEVWVLVPQVDGNSDHDFITLYYDDASNGGVADGQCGSCVFSAANGYTATWHMSDNTASASMTEEVSANATTLYNDLTTDNTQNHSQLGFIGRAVNFMGGAAGVGGGTQKEHFRHTVAWPKTSGTISHWLKPDQNRAMVALYESDGSGSANYNGFTDNNTIEEAHTACGGAAWNVTYQDGTNLYVNPSGGTATPGVWSHVTATWTRTDSMYLFVDGVRVAAADMASKSFGSRVPTVMQFGRTGEANDTRHWDGLADEVEISNVQRSPDWIRLAYQTQLPLASNAFWKTRTSPNNTVALTATAGSGNIALSWNTPVSDSANADSVGLWVKYSGYPDSATAASTTRVVKLAKTDTTYSYPATYPGTYWFALAVRNTNGIWSPFTKASSDTANLSGNANLFDTVYVDSAIGNNLNSCVQARNPATPMKNAWTAMLCGSGATDTLVVRMMPGIYTDSDFTITSKPTIITSFDLKSRAVLNGSGSLNDGTLHNATVFLHTDAILRKMDVKAGTNDYSGIYFWVNALRARVEGCRIYNNGSIKHHDGITITSGQVDQTTIANNLILQPLYSGIYLNIDNSFNILNNVIIGSATSTQAAINHAFNTTWTDMTIKNNIIQNWDYGIKAVAANIGVVASNLFYQVTSGREVTGVTNATGTLIKDPMFADTNLANLNAYKLLPGSPAIDAGSSTYASGGVFVTYRFTQDYFGNARTLGTAPDIGLYEGTGYTPNPAGDFDTLITSSTSTTVTVQNSKWKLVFDYAKGGGINFFSDMTAPSTNLLPASSVLFDAKIGSYTASANAGIVPTFMERTRSRAVVRQWLPVSASLNLDIYYTIYASGHIYVQSEISNISGGSTALSSVDYTLKLATTTSAFATDSSKNGFGYLTTGSRDALIAVTRDLNGGADTGDTWYTTATSGATGTIVFKTANPASSARFFKRYHDFLIYIGDASLDYQKAATLNADAYAPSTVTASSGSLLLERDWQNALDGHWNLDDGAGSVARDKAVYFQNNAALSGANYKWASGKVGGGLSLTATDVGVVTDNDALEATLGGTYMFWVKPDFATMGNTAFILSKGITTSDGWYFRKAAGVNKITFNMGAASATTDTLVDGAWTHICAVVRSTGSKQVELYVDGVLNAVSSGAATAVVNATDLRFGENAAGGATDRFKGILDDIRIFKNEIYPHDIQAVHALGFSSKSGHYALRADNNNRMVALLNGSAAQTRLQPAFQIANWSGPRTPKYVYLNGTRLTPNTDYVVDSVGNSVFGAYLVLQLNKTLTGADQTLFVDDDDSTGFMGEASRMKALSITTTANDKIAIQNFTSTTFGGATSGQWYMELDLNGWTTPTVTTGSQAGFGEVNVWKAAAANPNLAVSSATNLTGYDGTNGLHRSLTPGTYDLTATANPIFSGAKGYAGTANLTYTIADSSDTRLSIVLSSMSMTGDGTFTLTKRWTFYPTGRVIGSYQMSSISAAFNVDDPRIALQVRTSASPTETWSSTYAAANARWGEMGGNVDFHSLVGGILSVKNATSTYTTGASIMASAATGTQSDGSSDSRRTWLKMAPALFTQANGTNTTNFFVDFSKDFNDSATADSIATDLQTPAVITAITGTRTTTDALDFNADNFAEGDGAYTYAAAGGIAHFKFANTKTAFSPAFRINTWTQGTLPEVVILDNQVLTRGYHYNVYLNTAGAGGGELVMQFNKTLAPGTHVFFINHKTGLAVTLRSFEAKGGEGVDTLEWSTESEFENLGYHLYRRIAPGEAQIDSSLSGGAKVAGAGIANALIDAARSQVAAKAAAKLAKAQAKAVALLEGSPDVTDLDTLPSMSLTPEELAALGYVRITPKLIPGAKGGSSASTQDYRYIDRSAAFGTAYEYLLEAVDFNGSKAQYGPRLARPSSSLETELQSNYPNPFNPITTLRFSLKEKLKVSLIIYDGKGRVVRTLVRPDKPMLAGKYRLIWDAKNDRGFEVPSGQYFYRFTAARYVKTRKMILVK